MIKTIALHRLLERGQTGLNRILLATWAARGVVYAGLPAGFLILCGRLLGWSWLGLAAWAIACALGGLAGTAFGWRCRYDAGMTARWLDRHLGLLEALSAAVVCLGRDRAGGLDAAVIEHAENVCTEPIGIRWPVRRLLRWWGGAAATVLVFTAIIGAVRPIPRSILIGRESSARADEGPAPRLPAASRLAPRDIAKRLFPQNPWLEHRLEQALRAGDLAEVERLIAQAESEMDAAMAEAGTGEQRSQLTEEQERRRQAADKALTEMRGERGRGGGDPERRTDERRTAGEQGAAGIERPGGDGTSRFRTTGGTAGGRPGDVPPYYTGENSDNRGSGYGEKSKGGSAAGRGLEPGAGKSGPVTAKSGPQQAPISQQGDQYFEYVLPGSEMRIPLAQAAADSNRAAEGAIAREQLPLEYTDFIRRYFLQLTQEAAGDPPEEDEP